MSRPTIITIDHVERTLHATCAPRSPLPGTALRVVGCLCHRAAHGFLQRYDFAWRPDWGRARLLAGYAGPHGAAGCFQSADRGHDCLASGKNRTVDRHDHGPAPFGIRGRGHDHPDPLAPPAGRYPPVSVW